MTEEEYFKAQQRIFDLCKPEGLTDEESDEFQKLVDETERYEMTNFRMEK